MNKRTEVDHAVCAAKIHKLTDLAKSNAQDFGSSLRHFQSSAPLFSASHLTTSKCPLLGRGRMVVDTCNMLISDG